MEAIARPDRLTVQEYFRREAVAETRHEYHDGIAVAMAGGTYNHSLITMNVGGELRARLKGKGCQVLDSNLLVRIPRRSKYYYGDAVVVCGEAQFDSAAPAATAVLNPRLVVEVLSDSTERFDRGEKFTHYRELESLREYVLVSQHTARVEAYLRQDDGTWRFDPRTGGLEAVAKLVSIGVELPLAEAYANVAFPPAADDVTAEPAR